MNDEKRQLKTELFRNPANDNNEILAVLLPWVHFMAVKKYYL